MKSKRKFPLPVVCDSERRLRTEAQKTKTHKPVPFHIEKRNGINVKVYEPQVVSIVERIGNLIYSIPSKRRK